MTGYKKLENSHLIELIEARPDLEYLCICSQKLTSLAINKISELKNLKLLVIKDCHTFKELNLKPLNALRSLILQECLNLKKLHIANKNSLEKINIKDCSNLKIDLPKTMPHLKEIFLNNFLEFSFPKRSPKLQKIFWSNQNSAKEFFCDSFPSLEKVFFAEVSGLEVIKVLNCQKLSQIILPIQAPHLREIDVFSCPLIEKVICPYLPSLKTLKLPTFAKRLSFVDCSGNRSLESIILPKECPPLTLKLRNLSFSQLDLSSGWYLNMLDISYSSIHRVEFPTNMPYLERLDLSWNEDLEILNLPKKAPALKEIKGESCLRLEKINFEKLPGLKKINFSSCKNLKDFDLSSSFDLEIALLNTCQSLKNLNLTNSLKLKEVNCQSCSLLKNVFLPPQVSNLKKWNCSNCSDLRQLDLTTAFLIETINTSHCHQLMTLFLPKIAPHLVSVNVLANLELKKLSLPQIAPRLKLFIYAACSQLKQLSLPLNAPHLIIQDDRECRIKKEAIANNENYTHEQFCEFELSDDVRIQNFLKFLNINIPSFRKSLHSQKCS